MGRRINRRRKKTVSGLSIAARKAGLVVTLRRRDALVRQLDTAIRMWFFGQDPIPVHLLVMPAYHVLFDLGRKNGNAPNIHEFVGDSFDTGYDWLRDASSDPHDSIDFPSRVNDFLMWVCIISFEKIFGGRTVFMMAFQAAFVLWLVPEKPEFREGADAFLPDGISAEEAGSLRRLEFFDKLTEMFAVQIRPIP
jgi:hypothetical protein